MISVLLQKIVTIIVFLIIFTVIVVSHEFGHFLLGRLNGIKVREFAIGMGPVIFKKRLKSTVFKIHLLPLGGACVFDSDDIVLSAGESVSENEENDYKSPEEEAEDEFLKSLPGDKFQKAPIWGRIATVFAGPLFNFIVAYILCIFLVWFCGQDLPVVMDVSKGLPAEAAGIQAGDVITKINNQKVYLWREISINSMMNAGEPISIVYERDGREYATILTPEFDENDNRFYMGLIGGGEALRCNNISVFKYSLLEVRYWLIATYKSLVYIFSGQGSMNDVSGPVGVAEVIDDTIVETAPFGWFTVLLNLVNITVLLCVNLGVINLLPFPAIDGGRLLFLFFELITGKRVPPEKEGFVHLIGIVILFVFMIFVFFNDIMRVISKFI